MAADLAGAGEARHPRGQATGAAADAAARHSCPWQAPLPGHDHRQPARSADRAQPAEPQLHPATPNQAWSGDITYIATEEGWLFLAVVLDLFSRKVVGWSMRPDMQRSLVIDALEMACFNAVHGKETDFSQ